MTRTFIAEKLTYYSYLIRLNRPIGIYLLLWPTLWALWFAADGVPDLNILIIFVLGVAVMRSAGCAINDYADRDIDAHVERTKERPLAMGLITASEALGVFAALCAVAFILVLQLNIFTILLSTIALVLAATYPFMKRYHSFPQVHLGAAFGWAIPMAYTAITNNWPELSGWLIFIAALLWTTAYDTMYGITDREDDIKLGMKSTAILFGKYDRAIIFALQISTFMLLIAVGMLENMGWIYFLGLAIASGFVFYQQHLLGKGDSKLGLVAFLNNNWLGMTVFIGIALDFMYRLS